MSKMPGSYKKKRKLFIDRMKLLHQQLECYYCGIVLVEKNHTEGARPPPTLLTIDHITPISKGGMKVSMSNFRLCCLLCNQTKANNLDSIADTC